MMVSLDLRSCRPISAIFTSSTVISPAAASSSLKRQSVMEDLPAPVRPTIPICAGTHTQLWLMKPSLLTQYCLLIAPSPPLYLLPSFDIQCESFQDEVQSLSVAHTVVVELHVTLHRPFRWGLLILHLPGGLWTRMQRFWPGKLSEQLISLLGFQHNWFVHHSVCAESLRAAKHLCHLWDTLDAPNKGFH